MSCIDSFGLFYFWINLSKQKPKKCKNQKTQKPFLKKWFSNWNDSLIDLIFENSIDWCWNKDLILIPRKKKKEAKTSKITDFGCWLKIWFNFNTSMNDFIWFNTINWKWNQFLFSCFLPFCLRFLDPRDLSEKNEIKLIKFQFHLNFSFKSFIIESFNSERKKKIIN